jgi:hypothetical protein
MNWIARIFMGLLGLAFLAGLLVALGVYTVFATLRWLLTGRKPQVVLVWQQFRQMRQGGGMRWGAGMGSAGHAGTPSDDDVVDVQAREIHDSAPRLSDKRTID